jgi:hypothetical protein
LSGSEVVLGSKFKVRRSKLFQFAPKIVTLNFER